MRGELNTVLEILEGCDATPTTQAEEAANHAQQSLADLLARWEALKTKEVAGLNERLRQANLTPVRLE